MFIILKFPKTLTVNKKRTIGVIVSDEMRDRLQRVAALKHWSVSQTLKLFIDAYWEQWEKDLGVEVPPTDPTPKR